MIKKISRYISILAALTMLILVFPYTYAGAQDDDNRLMGVLRGLERVSDDFNYNPSDTVSRGDFVVNLLKLTDVYDMAYKANSVSYFEDVAAARSDAKAIAFAYQRGIVSGNGDGMFHPDEPITAEQAMVMLLRALGYGPLCDLNGGYPDGYISYAAETDILDGIEGVFGKELKQSDMVRIFYNALDAELIESEYENGRDTLQKSGETLLTSKNIYHKKGIMTANSKINLYGGAETGDLQVIIDTQNYYISDASIQELLGYYVDFYYKENISTGDRTILYIEQEPNKNEVVEIDAEDIVSASQSQYVYYSDRNKRTTASVKTDADFILNNQPLYEYSQEMLIPNKGSVKLIDNNGDRKYDLVFIDSRDVVIVKAILGDVIIDMYDSSRNVDLSGLNDSQYIITSSDGKEMELDDIKEWSVLLVRRSENTVTGRAEYDIIVNYVVESGTISDIQDYDDTKIISIDVDSRDFYSKQYIISKDVPEETVKLLKTGLTIKFCIDTDGEIAAIKTVSSDHGYAYLFTSYISDDGDNLMLRMYTDKGEFETLRCRRKNMTVDEHNYKEYDLITLKDIINGSLISPSSTAETVDNSYHMIRYRRNSDNEVYYIDTMTQSPEEKVLKSNGEEAYNGLRLVKSSYSQRYQSGTKSFSGVYNISEDTVVFNIPQDDSERKFFSVSGASYFKNDTAYKAVAYYTEYDQVRAPLAVMFASSGSNLGNDEPAIVAKITRGVNEDDETGYYLEMQKRSGVISCFASDDTDFTEKDISVGDVVRYSTNVKAEIGRIDKLFDYSEKTLWKNDTQISYHYLGGSDNYSYTDGFLCVANTVKRRKDDVAIMDINSNYASMRDMSFVLLDASPIFKMDTDARNETQIVKGSAMDIFPQEEYPENASYMFVYMSYGSVRWAYIVND